MVEQALRESEAEVALEAPPAAGPSPGASPGIAPGASPGEGARNGAPASAGPVTVARHFVVDPRLPIPELDQPQAEAYAVEDRRPSRGESRPPLFALVCAQGMEPRLDALRYFSRAERLPLIRPVAWDVVAWPGHRSKRFVILLTRPAGPRIQPAPDVAFEPFTEDAVVRKVVHPLLALFRDLKDRGLSHRAIRADNLFLADSAGNTVLLGECVSAPPAFDQAPIYETIDSMMAQPSGRGAGTQSDDLYAFGALLAVLLHGRDPCRHMSLAELTQAKISQGSYSAIVRDLRVSLPMMEMLRGLLCDDPRDRWQEENLTLWANGRHLSPKQPVVPPRGQRPFGFAGRDFWSLRALSAAMGHDWAAARDGVSTREVAIWVRRSLGEEKLSERLLEAVGSDLTNDSSATRQSDRSLARMLMYMDPGAPIRFRGFAARPEALTQSLAFEFEKPGMQQLFTEMIARRLPQAWMEAQPSLRTDQALLRRSFESLYAFVTRGAPGFGLERCLYEFNRSWPCLSPLVRDEHVTEIADLLPALERRAAAEQGRNPPIDRHLAAFVCAHVNAFPERVLAGLGEGVDPVARGIGVAEFLAEIVRRIGHGSYPRLAAWVARSLQPLVESFHSRKLRRQLEREIEAAVEAGDLNALASAVGNLERQETDKRGFGEARRHYAQLAREIRWLEDGNLTDPAFVASRAQSAAATLATFVSGVIVLVLTLVYMA